MTKQELVRSLKSAASGAEFITLSELTAYLGYKDKYKVKKKFLYDLDPVAKTKFFIPDVANRILEKLN